MSLAETVAHTFESIVEAATSPRDALLAAVRHYRDVRLETAPLDEDGDMLLFQWGTYAWDGSGPRFTVGLTRQLVTSDADADEQEMFQITIEAECEPESETEGIGRGEIWCSTPAGVDDFLAAVEVADAFRALDDRPDRWTVTVSRTEV